MFLSLVLPSMKTGSTGFCDAEHLNLLAQSLRPDEVGQPRHHSERKRKHAHSLSVLNISWRELANESDSSVLIDLICERIHLSTRFNLLYSVCYHGDQVPVDGE